MTRTLLTVTLVLLWTVSIGQSNDTIYYNARNKITWNDFKGTPTDTVKVLNAHLATTIQMRTTKVNIWTGVASFDVVAIAYKNLSWVKTDRKTDDELQHQQLQFDISEVIARRLKTEINNKKLNAGRQKKITEMFREFLNSLADMRKTYAVETKLGTDLVKQEEWEQKTWK